MIQVERFKGKVHGIASGHPIHIGGSVMLKVGFSQPVKHECPKQYKGLPAKFKIFGAGQSDWNK